MVGRKLTGAFFITALLVYLVTASGAAAQSQTKSWNSTWVGDASIVGYCKDGTLSFVETGVGLTQQMGKSAWSDKYCMNPTTWTASGRKAVITAENGDKVFLKITLLFTWTSQAGGDWVETETVIGGTGGYALATGGSHSKGTFTLTSPTTAEWEGTTTGLISY